METLSEKRKWKTPCPICDIRSQEDLEERDSSSPFTTEEMSSRARTAGTLHGKLCRNKSIDLEDPTPSGDVVHSGCTKREAKVDPQSGSVQIRAVQEIGVPLFWGYNWLFFGIQKETG